MVRLNNFMLIISLILKQLSQYVFFILIKHAMKIVYEISEVAQRIACLAHNQKVG